MGRADCDVGREKPSLLAVDLTDALALMAALPGLILEARPRTKLLPSEMMLPSRATLTLMLAS